MKSLSEFISELEEATVVKPAAKKPSSKKPSSGLANVHKNVSQRGAGISIAKTSLKEKAKAIIKKRMIEATIPSSQRGLTEDQWKKLVKEQIEIFAKAVKRPNEKWIRKSFVGENITFYGDGKHPQFWNGKTIDNYYEILLSNPEEGINLIFRISGAGYSGYQSMDKRTKNRNQDDYLHEVISVRGTTEFTKGGKWFSFDRRGIDDSFGFSPYSNYKTHADISKCIKDQVKKVHDNREKDKTTIALPGELSTWKRTPKEIETIKNSLNGGKEVHFSPAGMGTGKVLTKKKLSGFEGKKASAEIDNFFNVGPLYIGNFDAD